MSTIQTNGDSDSPEPSLLSRLSDDFLQCPMCHQRYCEPRLLTCLHAVCTHCLETLRQTAMDRQRFRLSFVSVECPACRRLTDVTPGVERLPCDSVRARLLEVVSLAEASAAANCSSCEMCAHSGRDRPATGRCLDCGKLLCSACRQRHRKVRVTSDHELVDLDRQTALNCDKHPRELVRFYCTSCQVPVCIGCTFSKVHSSHAVLKFKDAAQQKATELAEFSRLCSEKLQQLGSALQLARSLESQIATTEAAIKEAATQHLAAIRTAQQNLLNELREFYDCCSGLLAGRHEIAAALRDLTEVSSFTELVNSHKYSESLLLAPRVSSALARYADFQLPDMPVRARRYRLQFLSEQPVLGRLEKQRMTDSISSSSSSICVCSGRSRSGSIASDCCTVEVSSIEACDEAGSSNGTPERSFFTYDNSTLRSSVCRSLTTDTLVSPAADAECQTDFCLVVNLEFALICLHCSDSPEVAHEEICIPDAEELLPQYLAQCQTSEHEKMRCASSVQSVLLAIPIASVEIRIALFTCLCTIQEFLLLPESLESLCTLQPTPQENLLGAPFLLPPFTELRPVRENALTTSSEVRVCSVMFSSLESNEFDELELVRPTLLRDAGCQTMKTTSTEVSVQAAPCLPSIVAATQTPHLPTRHDLVAVGTQTVALALFSRDAQANPDTEERSSQTRFLRQTPGARTDKATQWESPGSAQHSAQRLYRSGRVVQVVGASVCERLALSPRSPRRSEAVNSSTETVDASEPQLHRLTETLSQKIIEFQPLIVPKAPPSTSSASTAVKFPKPKGEENSLDRLKNFCARLRQRRSGLGKQKIEVLKDK